MAVRASPAGGASRGAYQAGCLKRLEEEGIKPDLIIGSSIGVCNSLVYASGGAEALNTVAMMST